MCKGSQVGGFPSGSQVGILCVQSVRLFSSSRSRIVYEPKMKEPGRRPSGVCCSAVFYLRCI